MSECKNKDRGILREIYCKIASIKCNISSAIIKGKNTNDDFLRIVFQKLEKMQNEINYSLSLGEKVVDAPIGACNENVFTKKAIKSAISKKMWRYE